MISWDLPIHWLLGAVEIGTSQATFGIGGSLHHPLLPTGLADDSTFCWSNAPTVSGCGLIYIYINMRMCMYISIYIIYIYVYMYNTHLHSIPMVGFSSLGFWSQGSPKALPAYPLRVAPQLPGDCGQLWEHEDVCHWHQWGCSTRHLHIGVWVMSRCPKNGGISMGYPSYCLMGYYNWCNHGIQRNVMN